LSPVFLLPVFLSPVFLSPVCLSPVFLSPVCLSPRLLFYFKILSIIGNVKEIISSLFDFFNK
jgi:hypothetical protein